jgi:nucleotide-binding universal stress UspA family protein
VYRRIVVGTDNSVGASAAVDFAATLARRVGAHLHIAGLHRVHHCPPCLIGRPHGMVSAPESGDEPAMEVHRMHLELVAAQLRRRAIDVSIHVVAGDPASRLNDLAMELGADLIIIGARDMPRRGPRWHFSSVAASVVRTATVPVLIVPTMSGTNESDEW